MIKPTIEELEKLKNNPDHMINLDCDRNDYEFMKKVITINPETAIYIGVELIKNKEFILDIVNENEEVIKYLPQDIRKSLFNIDEIKEYSIKRKNKKDNLCYCPCCANSICYSDEEYVKCNECGAIIITAAKQDMNDIFDTLATSDRCK